MRTSIVIAGLVAAIGSTASAQAPAPPMATGTAFELTPYAGIPHRGIVHSLAFLIVLTTAVAFIAARGRTALLLA